MSLRMGIRFRSQTREFSQKSLTANFYKVFMNPEFESFLNITSRMSTISVSVPTSRTSRPPIVVRTQSTVRPSSGDGVALAADPDWDDQFPSTEGHRPSATPESKPKHPASKQDFMKLEDCGHQLAKRLGWGPLQGVALRESGQIAAQRYGYSAKTDAHLAEEAFSLLLAAI
jgi:hypothetical protein